ncbi:type VII secretion protein EccB [Corynebacterium sp. H128]|uniref:type VII secretion protein EccB n=1 Tax=unclassified Corynebacterium TaxID=2624378 RepID=UPI0030AFD388
MSSVLLATTKAQVSGHKFLTRRVEHGVVLGDIRMISDPLGARRRAALFGLIGTAIIAAGSGALAIFAPQVDPGDANIVRAESGGMYVRLPAEQEAVLHPVANLASARLILGSPEEAAKASDSVLGDAPKGVPVGIPDAPGIIAPHPQPAHDWSASHSGGAVTVVAGQAPPALIDGHGVLARSDGRTWVITAFGRAELPAEDSPLGRSLRRRLGITPDTPIWEPPAAVLSAVTELPPYREIAGTLLVGKDEYWLEQPKGLVPLSELQYRIGLDLGLEHRELAASELSSFPDSVRSVAELPVSPVQWQRPEHVWVRGDGKIALAAAPPAGIQLSGDSAAHAYSGPTIGGIGVDTGHGTVIVTEHGRVHRVATPVDAAALGIVEPQSAPWAILSLLPEGAPLSHKDALRPTY